ncbi:MAG: cystathionine beta-lyase [Halieaceae bacterium]|jgi:cystathionine beta-lyase|nr:cystathionine beta-lyase [Halieaceae bacterium]
MSKHHDGQAVETRLVTSGRSDPRVVSTPVYHVSTVLFKDYAELREREAGRRSSRDLYYGRMGTPTTQALEDALCALDNSVGAVLTPSGVASITDILSAFLAPGDHLLMVDSVYGPTRGFCLGPLAKRGITTEFYDPMIGAAIDELIRPETRLVFLESPGSATFEVQDVAAITAAARARDVLTAIDNTWATPLLFNPLDHGVDLAMQSGTKYLNGHADCLFGVTTTRSEELYTTLRHYTLATGSHLAGDDAMLALRGLRSLAARLPAHDRNARAVATWLEEQARVRRILHPAWPSCPGHAYFERDFAGASGLFGVVIEADRERDLAAFLDSLTLFGMGFSWGGFESLCLPMEFQRDTGGGVRLADDEVLLRLHIGLEHPADLVADLARAFAALDAVAG